MKSKRGFIVLGTLLSGILLIVLFSRLNWTAFLTALKTIHPSGIILALGIISLNIALRSLRWHRIMDLPLKRYQYTWQAANIGYLGNIIYPARAGEILRILAIHQFSRLTLGHAASSAIIDRLLDMIAAGLFTLIVLWLHSHKLDSRIGIGAIVMFVAALFCISLLLVVGTRLQHWVQRWPNTWPRFKTLFIQVLEGVHTFRQTRHLPSIILLTVSVFLLDYYWMWRLLSAFGWALPFEAGLTLGVFILLGASLPSAPGHIGIYQVACVFALQLYGIEQAAALAYSVVAQLLFFIVVGIQGGWVALQCGFNLSQKRSTVVWDDSTISKETL